MPSCLGLYIGENIIKYAKISKERDIVKVDSFGIKIYDKIDDTIKQIIAETYSYKTPISVNLSEEVYDYFEIFSLLNKADIPKVIKTEFESICYEKGFNSNALESRYALVDSLLDKEKLKVINISTNKTEINKRIQQLDGNKVNNILPLPMVIPNLINTKTKENILIVNIEEKTSITTIIDSKIYNVSIIEEGSNEILDKINIKENSYSKAYKICKNSTIYTNAGKELQDFENNEYLDDIMPTLYNIVNKVKKIINEDLTNVEKVFITGTASVINNIDLYFSENLENVKCEILKPYFIDSTFKKINIKDYIEVNSAISLALHGVSGGKDGINFKTVTILDRILDLTKIEIGNTNTPKKEKDLKSKFNKNIDFKFDFSGKLDKLEINLLRAVGGVIALIIIYVIIAGILTQQIKNKKNEVEQLINDTKSTISLIDSDINKINTKTSRYKEMEKNLQNINSAISEKYNSKEIIPNFLNQLMYNTPKTVTVISIENTSDRKIKIIAQSDKYEQLAFFKAQLRNENMLKNIVSDQGTQENDLIKTTIEGELP